MKHFIKDIIGVNCITLQDGQRIYDLIYKDLAQKNQTELDFGGVRIVASPFLNAAIGQLLQDFSSEDLTFYLKITNLSATARPTLRRVIENAREYYSSENIQRATDMVLAKEARDNHAD